MNHDHNDMDGSKLCPMIMTFHGGHCERILWKSWVASTVTEFVFSALAIFLVSFLYEALKFLREYFVRQCFKKEAERAAIELQNKSGSICTSANGQPACHGSNIPEIRQKFYNENIFSKSHLVQCLFNVVQIIISYLLMLIVMTFNYWLCLAAVSGLGVGYFFFGWFKQNIYDSDCCN